MLKKSLCFALLYIISSTYGFALDKTNTKNININDAKISEADLYQKVYDMEYNAGIDYWVGVFNNEIGISAGYFIDDIKNYAKCEAELFTQGMSIDDYKTITTEYYSDDVKTAIREGLMINAKPCVSKFLPYLDEKEATVREYVLRKCGTTDEKSTEKQKREWYYCTAPILKKFDMCPESICPKN